MARERSRHQSRERRGPVAPEPAPDPIGRLDDVLATLEEMLDEHGVPPPPVPPPSAGRESPAREPGEPGSLPLLQDVVAPGANGRAEVTDGATGPGAREADGSEGHRERGPSALGFELIPDDPVPRIGDLDLDVAAGDPAGSPGGERYGDAPPPSLDPKVYRHLIDRLANEIDVIVQTGTEEAMRRAATDIAARVREHVAIILPEVIEELVRMSNRPRG